MEKISEGNCFKILQKANNSLYSYFLRYSDSYIEYSTTEVNYPTIGKLFVFDTYENAKNEIDGEGYLEIWECFAEDLEILPIDYRIPLGPPLSEVKRFWEDNEIKLGYEMYVPKGTCFCSSLKLIRKVNG